MKALPRVENVKNLHEITGTTTGNANATEARIGTVIVTTTETGIGGIGTVTIVNATEIVARITNEAAVAHDTTTVMMITKTVVEVQGTMYATRTLSERKTGMGTSHRNTATTRMTADVTRKAGHQEENVGRA